MGMPADQANPLDEVEPTIETNDATNNVQPPARDSVSRHPKSRWLLPPSIMPSHPLDTHASQLLCVSCSPIASAGRRVALSHHEACKNVRAPVGCEVTDAGRFERAERASHLSAPRPGRM